MRSQTAMTSQSLSNSSERCESCKKPANVIAEFKKFDIHKLQKGVVTKDCVRKVFKAEMIETKHPLVAKDGFTEELDKRVNLIMQFDSDNDGLITFKDFYEHMLRRIP